MRDIAELVAGWIHALRITSPQQWALRLAVVAAGAGALLLCWSGFPVAGAPALLVAGALAAGGAAIRPHSGAALALVAVVAVWWLGGAAEAPCWQWLSTAALVALAHTASAHAAAAPSYARITRRAAGRMGLAAAVVIVGGGAAGGVVLAVAAVADGRLGPGWVVAGALALGAATVATVAATEGR